jgi:hypothetical protein
LKTYPIAVVDLDHDVTGMLDRSGISGQRYLPWKRGGKSSFTTSVVAELKPASRPSREGLAAKWSTPQ